MTSHFVILISIHRYRLLCATCHRWRRYKNVVRGIRTLPIRESSRKTEETFNNISSLLKDFQTPCLPPLIFSQPACEKEAALLRLFLLVLTVRGLCFYSLDKEKKSEQEIIDEKSETRHTFKVGNSI